MLCVLLLLLCLQEHCRVLAAAAAVKAAEELGADGKEVTRAAISAAVAAEPAGDGDEECRAAAEAITTELQRQQEKKQQQQQQQRVLRMRPLQRSGSIAAGGGCRSRMRGALRDRSRPAAAAATAESGGSKEQQQQQQQQGAQHVPPQVPVTGVSTASSGDVWGLNLS
jgi:protein-tyrosine-phosphatase